MKKRFFYKNERKLILEFKELGKGKYFISFYSYLRQKDLLQRLIYTNFVSVRNGLRYKFIKLNYIVNISKFEFVFEVKSLI